MSERPIAIQVDTVSKTFRLPHEKNSSIKTAAINFYQRRHGYELQHVLKKVSFDVKQGEFFGIVGRNGSGKSTLLKLLAGIYTPDTGEIAINGKLTPFIELGVGFNPELTGRENVYLNGALLGFNHAEVDSMYRDIVDFAELEKFMDQKLKNYSSGMQVRLAFSIAIRAKSDILLFDEVLAVGDAAFQQKCYEKFSSLHEAGRTVVLVTHDMSAVQRFCDRALLIKDGVIEALGKPSEIADQYLAENFDKPSDTPQDKNNHHEREKEFDIQDITIVGPADKTGLNIKDPLSINFVLKNPTKKNVQIGFQIFNSDGVYCFGTNTQITGNGPLDDVSTQVTIKLDQNLVPGLYYVTLAVMNSAATTALRYMPKVAKFSIKQQTQVQGVALLDCTWTFNSVTGGK